MTSASVPGSAPLGGTDQLVRLRDPAGLLAAVPVLLGFRPENSLVLIGTGGPSGRRLGLTLRVDLPRAGERRAVCEAAARSLLAGGPTGAAVVVVAGPGRRTAPRAAADVGGSARSALRRHGLVVHTALWTGSISAGARWACLDGCCRGAVPDPTGTELAAAAVAAGQVLRPDRAALAALVAPVDRARLRRRDRMLAAHSDGERPPDADPDAAGRDIVEAAIGDAAVGRLVLDDDRVVGLAVALTDPVVRDLALARSAGPDAAAAEQLWAALARESPDPEAAEPAALLAACALLRGDGALAGVALDRAERAWPGHRLTRLLRSVAELGVAPDIVRRCMFPEGDR